MQRELMPEQIKVDPGICFSAPLAAKNVFKESRCCCQIGNRKGQMKGCELLQTYFRTRSRMPSARLSDTDE